MHIPSALLGVYYCTFIINLACHPLLLPHYALLQPHCLLQHNATSCCSCHQLLQSLYTLLNPGLAIHCQRTAVNSYVLPSYLTHSKLHNRRTNTTPVSRRPQTPISTPCCLLLHQIGRPKSAYLGGKWKPETKTGS